MNDFLLMKSMLESMFGQYDPNYDDLTLEEKNQLDFVDLCLFTYDNEKIRDACSNLMFLILRYCASLESTPMSDDEFIVEKNKITADLNDDEKCIIYTFGYCLINSMGIYSEENIKLRKERK